MRSRRSVTWLESLAIVSAAWLTAPMASANLACQARASYPYSQPPVRADFQALAANGVAPLGFHWDFGDGGSSTEQNPSHQYSQTGIYTAILTVTDAGASQQVCRDTVPVYVSVVVDPLCIAQASTRWGDAPLSVHFDAYPGLIGDPEPYTWSWRFGDEETSTLQSPLHTYSGAGTYYAVATLHTPRGSYDCLPTLRVTSLDTKAGVEPPVPRDLHLDPPLPNPFRVMTGIGFVLPGTGRVRLTVSDVEGRLVATLVDGYRSAGHHVAVWQGRLDAGPQAPPGLYFLRLEHGGTERVVRVARLE